MKLVVVVVAVSFAVVHLANITLLLPLFWCVCCSFCLVSFSLSGGGGG